MDENRQQQDKLQAIPSDGPSLAEQLNQSCRCISVDPQRLERAIETSGGVDGLFASIRAKQPHLFSGAAVFVARGDVERMQATVQAIEAVSRHPGYIEAVLAWAPEISRFAPGPRGVFMGFDFHLGRLGPQLIEINTNAGGAFLNLALSLAQQACCEEIAQLVSGPYVLATLESEFVAMFRNEWELQRGSGTPLRAIAIVDSDPESQYLHPEFLLARETFRRANLEAQVVDPRSLHYSGGRLFADDWPIDLVYNRLTDFHLEEAVNSALRNAYLAGDVVVTPHPRSYALFADKRNLTLLSNPDRLHSLGIVGETAALLAATIPATRLLDPERADSWWSERKRYFFKPVSGYGSKAAYRGDKLTRSTWSEITTKPYVAQALVPPSERTIVVGDAEIPLKLDLRNYSYAGTVQLLAARLYQGQTTNFRTAGGGFAPVFTEPSYDAPSACLPSAET